jgi:hypothetical protein
MAIRLRNTGIVSETVNCPDTPGRSGDLDQTYRLMNVVVPREITWNYEGRFQYFNRKLGNLLGTALALRGCGGITAIIRYHLRCKSLLVRRVGLPQ